MKITKEIKSIAFQNGFIALPVIVVLLIVVVGGLVGFRAYQQSHSQQAQKQTIAKQVLVRRSKIPNVIVNATTAKAIDVKTGKVITAAAVFTNSDKTIYLALDLDSAKSGTNIDYIRYLNGRYVDHGNSKLNKDAVDNISFSWTNNRSLGSVIEGKWKIATYTNGLLEKRVNYTVSKNQVTDVFEDKISLADVDYHLNHILISSSK